MFDTVPTIEYSEAPKYYLQYFFCYREATRNDYDYVTVQYGGGCSSQVGKYGGEQILTLGMDFSTVSAQIERHS